MNKTNISKVILIVFCLSNLFCYGCKRIEPQGEVLAKINNYILTVDDFKNEITHFSHSVKNISDKKELIDSIIIRELLIQEAQRKGLDRNEAFMGSIERYWKQTLVKEVLKSEGQRLKVSMDDKAAKEALGDWIDELFENADIKINEEALKKIEN